MDGFHKLSQMAEEVFGEDVFSSGKTKNKRKENVTGRWFECNRLSITSN